MSAKTRIKQLESIMPKTQGADVATLRPSEILALADKLIEQGYTPTADERARLDSMRLVMRKDGEP